MPYATLKVLLTGAALLVSMAATAQASPCLDVALVLSVDGSASVSSRDFDLQ